MLDHKSDKEYPEERITKADFPLVSELYVYGKDVPAPTCVDELACNYKEGIPELVLPDDLIGFCVPPKGIVTIAVHGLGLRAGKGGMIYPPGTFREDKHTMNKEFGITQQEGVDLREANRKNAIIDAVAAELESRELLVPGKIGMKTPEVIAATVSWAFAIIDDAGNAREALNFTKWLESKLSVGDDAPAKKEKSSMTPAEAKDILLATAEIIKAKQGEVIDAEFVEQAD